MPTVLCSRSLLCSAACSPLTTLTWQNSSRAIAFANSMRKGHCNECHVPNNPTGMRRLVLLQTPAHAASEIKRLMNAVRQNDMPLDDTGLYREIDADTKAALLQYGAAFEAVVDAAREWERTRTGSR